MKSFLPAILLALSAPPGQDRFAAPDGRPENAGTMESPWDLSSALGGAHPIAPGQTLWVRGGTYRGKFDVKLAGTPDQPVRIRAWPKERAKIEDSGVTVSEPSNYVWLWDLEILGSAPVEKRSTDQTGSWPKGLPGTSGLEIRAGRGCKFINLVIHDNLLGGVGWWAGSTDSEFHGCLIYNNGWKAPDRTHGHCIYTQNKEGVKTISSCILTVPPWGGSHTMHAYGSSRAFVDNYVIEDNIAFERGPFLVGGGQPSHRIVVRRNYLHRLGLQIGYSAPENEDCEVRDNILVGGKLDIRKYKKADQEGNLQAPTLDRVILIPNKYDPARAHVAVFNSSRAALVSIPVARFLHPGDSYQVLDSRDIFGKPLAEGISSGDVVRLPLMDEFAALVVVRSGR
jgi:hypothetical protein